MSSQKPAAGGNLIFLLLVLLLTIPAWAPLTGAGLPQTQTGPLPVLTLYALERGETPVVATPAEGDWPYLVARAFRALGANGVTAIKWSLFGALALLAIGMAGWGTQLAGRRAGLLATALALYCPALLSAVYGGGEFAAVWAVAGLALAGWGIFSARGWRWALLLAGTVILLGSAALAGLAGALGLVLLAGVKRRWSSAGTVAAATIAALLWQRPWTQPNFSLPTDHLSLYQLLEPGWQFNVSSLGWDTPLSFSLGLPLLALIILVLWLNKFTIDHWPLAIGHLILGLALALLSLLFIPQFLYLSIPFLTIAAVSALRLLPDLRQAPIWAVLVLLPILGAGPALSPEFSAYAIPEATTALFDDQIIVFGLESSGDLQPGGTVTVEATWLTLDGVDFDYNVFAHVLDGGGNKITQLDVQPQAGARPMTTWQPGEPIPDRYTLVIPADAPADLRIRFGLYNWQTLNRLAVGDSNAIEIVP